MLQKCKKVLLVALVLLVLFCLVNIGGRLIIRYVDSKNFVSDATVCETTGNLSFLTADYRIMTYSPSGELLWETSLTDNENGYGNVNYYIGYLQIALYRTNLRITYDENGNILSKEEIAFEGFEPDWNNKWIINKQQKQFSTNSHEYIYIYPSLLEVLKGNNEVFFIIRSSDTKEEVRINLK